MELINDKTTRQESDGSEQSSNESMDEAEVIKEPEISTKKKKRGIVYISSIPKYMTVSILREHLGRYASIGRVYLQAAATSGNCVNLIVETCCYRSVFFFFKLFRKRKKTKSSSTFH